MRTLFLLAVLAVFPLALSSCARDLGSDVYTTDATLSLTMEGKILSSRPVKLQDIDDASDSQLGSVGGALAGGAAGVNTGSGNGQVAAAIGGAVAGAAIGAVAEKMLSTSEGFEYVVKLDIDRLKHKHYEGSGAMRKAISAATTNGLVTVVQKDDVMLPKNTPVYVIFSDKRVRVIPAQ